MNLSEVILPPERLSDCVTFFRPTRPPLVTTLNPDGSVNVAPFAWCSAISWKPPMVALALLSSPRRQHSLDNIERQGEFVVNFPSLDMAETLVRTSFRYPVHERKATILGLQFRPAQVVAVPWLEGCRAYIECRLSNSLVTGDHTLLIADVVAAAYDPSAYDEHYVLQIDRCKPVLHLGLRKLPDRQVHFFLIGFHVQAVEVPYGDGAMDPDAGCRPAVPNKG